MRRRKRPYALIGVAGVLVVVAIAYIAFARGLPFVNGYRMKAEFASSNQLVTGFSPVRVAGVTVGKVVGVERGERGTTIVEMEIDDSARPIRADATARIRPRLFLEGGFAIELTTGSPSAGELEDGATLPRKQTALPVQLDQILGVFDSSSRRNLQTVLGELEQGLGNGGARALGRAFKPLSPALRDTAQVAEAVRGQRPGDLSGTIRATSEITAALAAKDGDLRGLVTNLARTTTAVAERDVELAATVRAAEGLVREAPATLDAIDATVPAIRRFVTALDPSLEVLPGSLNRTLPLLDELERLTRPGELPGLIRDLTPPVKRLPLAQRRLRTLFDLVTPVSKCLDRNVIPTLSADVPDGRHSTNRPVWQEMASAIVGLSGASSTFDGNGYAVRYAGGLGLSSVSLGQLPGLEELLQARTDEPLSGSSPRWLGPGVNPPYRPDVPCAESAPPDLGQRTGGGAGARQRKLSEKDLRRPDPVTKREFREAFEAAEKEARP